MAEPTLPNGFDLGQARRRRHASALSELLRISPPSGNAESPTRIAATPSGSVDRALLGQSV